jgi:hypothetical protein
MCPAEEGELGRLVSDADVALLINELFGESRVR